MYIRNRINPNQDPKLVVTRIVLPTAMASSTAPRVRILSIRGVITMAVIIITVNVMMSIDVVQ